MPEQKRNLSIAFLTTFIDNQINKYRFFGIADRAAMEGATLFCLLPRFLNDISGFDRQANVLIDFVTADYFDGVIVGNIIREDNTTDDDVRQLFARFSLPHVSIHENSVGVPFIPTDNAGGIALIVAHLVRVHKCSRIVYVRGPQQHPYAEQRLHAFRETMKQEGLAVNESLITSPGSWWRSNFQVILDERKFLPGTDFDAVVCANDIIAIEVMKMLQERGYSIPRDVIVAGFNNTVECTVFTPTLTSVELPFYRQGFSACDMLLNLLKGKSADSGYSRIELPKAELVVRDSCGCVDPVIREMTIAGKTARKGSGEPGFAGRVKEIFKTVFAAVLKDARDVEELSSCFLEFCVESRKPEGFFRVFHHQLDKCVISGGNIAPWTGLFINLRAEILPLLPDEGMAVRAETLFHQMRTYVFQTCIRLQKTATLEHERLSDGIRKFGIALISTFDTNKIMDETVVHLARFGIGTCFVSLYEDPARPAEFSRLVLAVKDEKRIPLEREGLRFASCEIVPRQYLDDEPGACFIVAALFFRDRQIGFICFKMTRRDTVIYEMIKEQLNTALQIALSIRDVEGARKELAKQADELARSNAELEQFAYIASHDLREPLRKITTMSDRIMEIRKTDPAADVNDYLDRMNKAGIRMHRLIEDLLAYSRVARKPSPFEPVDLNEVLSHVVNDLDVRIRQSGARVEAGDLPVIMAEPVQMRQLFQNLIGNAIKFRRKNLKPVVRIKSETDGVDFRRLTFADNGIGIKKEYYSRIFGIFERLHSYSEYEGSGIGLSICKKIVDHHKGTIEVSSLEGDGTTFTIRLPLRQN